LAGEEAAQAIRFSRANNSPEPLATAKPWEVCGISRAQWFKLYSSGRTPLAIRLGARKPVFLIRELEAWLEAGAPDRQTWLKTKKKV
jgi:predicted DNA-binding transcriptional regulator AlpA